MATETVAQNKKSESTVDTKDIEFHTGLVHQWWNPARFLIAFNEIRVPFIRDGILLDCTPELKARETPLDGKTILDVGCGGGILSEPLAKLGANVTGVDASADLIELAIRHSRLDHMGANRPTYIYSTIEDHAESNANAYNAVIASEIIEHVANPDLFLNSCIKVLKPGGRIFITTPNRTMASRFCVIFVAETVTRTIPTGTHQYDKFLTPSEVKNMLEKYHCKVELTRGISANFFRKKWNWSKNPNDIFYAIQAVKLDTDKSSF